ncbi:MAG: PKD domain-containing protein [Chitinophagales bacterium]
MQQRIFISVFLVLFSLRLFAFHIVGGELYYDCLGDDNYRITLKLYRDCNAIDAALFDDPLYLYIYDASQNLVQTLEISLDGPEYIDPDLTNPCIVNPPEICVEEGIYTTIVNLPPSPGGYDLVYQRCCRNSSLVNLVLPDATGATYWQHIPDPGDICNSSPRFNDFPPIIICGNYPLVFDHSATDPDGDELVYEFYQPFAGGSPDYPTPTPSAPPPFFTVNYDGGFSYSYPLNADPALSIDATTGLLTGTPTSFGQYVVGIAVKEYRDGVLLDTHFRDFQFNVTDCEPAITAVTPNEINNCSDFTVDFENDSYGTEEFFWDFGVPGITSDTSSETEPTYTYSDTGTYIVMLIAFPGETCSDTVYSTVNIYPQLIADFSFESGCALQEINFTDASTTDHGYLTDWSWDFGDGENADEQNPAHAFEEGGTYTVELTVKNDVGCTEDITQSVLIYPLPEVDFIIEDDCLDQLGMFTDASTIAVGYSITGWNWDVNNDDIGTDPFATYFFDTTGVYSITLTTTTNVLCVDSFTHYVHIDSPLVAELTSDTTMCELDSIQLFARSGITYTWSPDISISDIHAYDPFVYPSETTTYSVIVCDHCSCDTGYVTIEVLPAPDINAIPRDTTVFKHEPVQLFAEGAEKFSWVPAAYLTDAQSPEPVSTPPNDITYFVYAVGFNGCDNTDTVHINTISDCWRNYKMPNAFSPNQDGLNDVFRIVTTGDENVPGFYIFDRWGEIVFQTSDLSEPWDGTSQGKNQENGVYFYILTAECEGVFETLYGTVTLLR